MVRSKTLPFTDYALATPGQIAWVFLNTIVDYDEKRGRVHLRCLAKFDQTVCEVCYEPLNYDIPEELRDKVYRPGVDGILPEVEVEFPDRVATSSGGSWELIDHDEASKD